MWSGFAGSLVALVAVVLLGGCAVTLDGSYANQPARKADEPSVAPSRDIVGKNLIALAFSGGGLRSAAFSFGVLQALDEVDKTKGDLLDDLTFITSVSGGSLTAAYYGVYGKKTLQDFRSKVLALDIERSMRLSAFSPESIARVLKGGLNDRSNLITALDKDIFSGATFADMYRRKKPDVWINASDLYNRTPFPFLPPLFASMCSDLASLPVAEAVYASMAVPLLFAPLALETFPNDCVSPLPAWMDNAIEDPSSPRLLDAAARAARNYRDPKVMRYVKLSDGGITDNFGLSSILIGRAASRTLYGPLTDRDAVNVNRMLFLVVDAGRGPSGDWAVVPTGPSGIEIAVAATDAAIDSAARNGFDAFKLMLVEWQTSVINFRCSLDRLDVLRLRGTLNDWNCKDVEFNTALVTSNSLGNERALAFGAIPTRLTLPASDIDNAVTAGRDATRANAEFQKYIARRRDTGAGASASIVTKVP